MKTLNSWQDPFENSVFFCSLSNVNHFMHKLKSLNIYTEEYCYLLSSSSTLLTLDRSSMIYISVEVISSTKCFSPFNRAIVVLHSVNPLLTSRGVFRDRSLFWIGFTPRGRFIWAVELWSTAKMKS